MTDSENLRAATAIYEGNGKVLEAYTPQTPFEAAVMYVLRETKEEFKKLHHAIDDAKLELYTEIVDLKGRVDVLGAAAMDARNDAIEIGKKYDALVERDRLNGKAQARSEAPSSPELPKHRATDRSDARFESDSPPAEDCAVRPTRAPLMGDFAPTPDDEEEP
jgi:hypothetical protein